MRGDADHRPGGVGYLTNDLPGCPTGGLLSGTEGADILSGEEGEDEVRALGTPDGQADELYGGSDDDAIYGGAGMDFLYGEQDDDVLYGGDGDDILLVGGKGADVIYGGDGDDFLRSPLMGSGISSIAAKAGTNTLPRRSTMYRAVARRAGSSIPAALP
jgi:Ca2+-binding RTX toxin-like protein